MLIEQADFFGATETPHAARTAGFEPDLVKYIIRSCNMLQEVAQNSSSRDRLLLASPQARGICSSTALVVLTSEEFRAAANAKSTRKGERSWLTMLSSPLP